MPRKDRRIWPVFDPAAQDLDLQSPMDQTAWDGWYHTKDMSIGKVRFLKKFLLIDSRIPPSPF